MTLSHTLKNICPECGSKDLVSDDGAGEVVCRRCGLVVDGTVMDTGPEWRAFTIEESEAKRRTGPSVSFSKYDKGLSSKIGFGGNYSSQKFSLQDRYRMLRLRKWNIRSRLRSTAERNLSQAMGELNRLCDKMKIPSSIQESAAVIYRKALKEDLVRGRSIASIAAASLYLALRRANVPRTLKEICDASTRSRKEISRCYRLLLWKLGYMTPIDDPVYYVSKIATTVGLSQRVQTKAIELLREGRQRHVTVGKDPSGMAAAALYIACVELGEKVTQKKLAEAGGITEVTVRNRYKGLIKDMKLNIVKAKTR
jgi:transcription initiation factor TFIIB